MNVFDQLMSPPKQRPGDPRDTMSYAEAMALRDRHRAGQPVDKEKLAEAGRIVDATRKRLAEHDAAQPPAVVPPGKREAKLQKMRDDAQADMEPRAQRANRVLLEKLGIGGQQEQPEAADDAGASASVAITFPEWRPKPGGIPWKVYKWLKKYPHKKLTRAEISSGFECFSGGIDGLLDVGVARGAFVKGRNSMMQLTWGLGPSDNVVILAWGEKWEEPNEHGELARREVKPAAPSAAAEEACTVHLAPGSMAAQTFFHESRPAAAQPPQSRSIAAQPPRDPAAEAPPAAPQPAAQPAPVLADASIQRGPGATHDRRTIFEAALEALNADADALRALIASTQAQLDEVLVVARGVKRLLGREGVVS